MSDDVGAHLAALFERLSHLEGIVERSHRQGTVTDVDYSDASKPRARIGIGLDDQGKPVKGPWVPIMSHAGARTIHAPVTVGQQMMQVSPHGNLENGMLVPLGFSKPIPSPSTDPNAYVDQIGSVTTTLTKDNHVRTVKKNTTTHDANGFTINCDGTTYAFTKDGFTQTGGKQSHDGKNVGATHIHGGVTPGGSDTEVPEA